MGEDRGAGGPFTAREREFCRAQAARGVAYHARVLRDAHPGVTQERALEAARELVARLERIAVTGW